MYYRKGHVEVGIEYLLFTCKFVSKENFDEALCSLLFCLKQEMVCENGSFFSGIHWDKVGRILCGIEVWCNTEKKEM